jgi:hypothetical protein
VIIKISTGTSLSQEDSSKMPKETCIQVAVREFRRAKALADDAMAQITPEQFFAVPSEGDNSIAVIVKHVGGNLLSRWTDFMTSDGEKPGRNRDCEFEITSGDTQPLLLRQWESGWAALSLRLIRSVTPILRGRSQYEVSP